MVHPLVQYDQRAFHRLKVGDRVLRENCKSIGGNQFRNSVVDLRVDVVGTPGQDNSPAIVVLHPLESLLAFFTHVISGVGQLFPGFVNGGMALLLMNTELFLQNL